MRDASQIVDVVDSKLRKLEPFCTSETAKPLWEAACGNKILDSAIKAKLPIDRWQQIISQLIRLYVQTYQASSVATYKRIDSKKGGNAEGTAIGYLEEAEEECNNGSELSRTITDLSKDMESLIDVQQNVKTLGAGEYAFAVSHWIEALGEALPSLIKAHGVILLKPFLSKGLSPSFTRVIGKDAGSVIDLLTFFGHGDTVKPWVSGINIVNGMDIHNPSLRIEDLAGEQSTQLEILKSGFTANVDLEPTESGQGQKFQVDTKSKKTNSVDAYKASQLNIRRIQLGDLDRPKTKFVGEQRSHTSAWTLVRQLIFAQQGKMLDRVLIFLKGEFVRLSTGVNDVEKMMNKNAGLAQSEAKSVIDKSIKCIESNSDSLPIFKWQELISKLLWNYVTTYQLSDSASYHKPGTERATGNSEGIHMSNLRKAEYSLWSGRRLPDSPTKVVDSAVGLLDVQRNDTLSDARFIEAVLHWGTCISEAFPEVASLGGDQIVEKLGEKIEIDSETKNALKRKFAMGNTTEGFKATRLSDESDRNSLLEEKMTKFFDRLVGPDDHPGEKLEGIKEEEAKEDKEFS